MDETILLVDDEEGIRKVLGISLADSGYKVLTAGSGEEALQLFQKTKPPIVLTDIKMPGMNGLELLQAIKRQSPDTEVIMITGHGDIDLAISSLKHEAADFITKPINDEILEIALKRVREKISMKRRLKDYTEKLEEMVREQSARLVESERLAAVGQAVEGLTSALQNIGGDIRGGINLFNEVPCFVSIHNRSLKVMGINRLYKERLGDRTGDNSWEIYSGGAAISQDCPVGKTFTTGQGQRVRETVRYKNGAEVPVIVHTAPVRGGGGHVELVLEISADASEISRIQEELRATQQKYQQLFDEVPCYITVQDKDLVITAANRQFKEDFGDAPGSYCYRIYKHRTNPCPDCPVLRTFEQGTSQEAEMVVASGTGEQTNVLIHTAPIMNARGEISQVMEVSTNITQIRQLQSHLTSLGLLLGSISHGVKGLLTALDGGMYKVNSGFAQNNPEQVQEGWAVIELMVSRIKRAFLSILYYAKERDLRFESCDVLSLLNELRSTVEQRMLDNKIDFIRDFDRNLGEFEIDPEVMRPALVNILENAIEACVDDKKKSRHRITFSARRTKDKIELEVADNGVGMDKETREAMFTLFFSSRGSRGTGLGLFISNQAIRRHGGSITVASAPGSGSSFKVSIPVTREESTEQSLSTI